MKYIVAERGSEYNDEYYSLNENGYTIVSKLYDSRKEAEEIGMKESNYLKIELGKSNPTVKTLERIAKLTNSTLVIDLIPNDSEQLELQLDSEISKKE